VSTSGASAVFFDRDGTLIEDVGYPREPDRVRLLHGVPEALLRLGTAGFRLVVVSNQSGIGRGIVQVEEAQAVHERFVSELERQGITLDGAKYCPHAPDAGCDCRKPSPGLLLSAADELGLDLEASFMIGDKQSDLEAGRRAGCRVLMLAGSAGAERADYLAADWQDAVDFILGSRAAA
jgi:D-glycero-D-manno-heptose 1,7-bisphosphate phosphatase